MTSNNKTNRTVGKNMDRIMELLSKLRFYGMLETYKMTAEQHPLMV